MANFLDKVKDTGNKLLGAELVGLSKWEKLRHTKDDLEFFLNFNIAEIQYLTNEGQQRSIVCTSNTSLVNAFNTKKQADKQAFTKENSVGIKTKDRSSVDTWDLIANKRKTVNLSSWQIVNFITISPDNILILDKIFNELLKK